MGADGAVEREERSPAPLFFCNLVRVGRWVCRHWSQRRDDQYSLVSPLAKSGYGHSPTILFVEDHPPYPRVRAKGDQLDQIVLGYLVAYAQPTLGLPAAVAHFGIVAVAQFRYRDIIQASPG